MLWLAAVAVAGSSSPCARAEDDILSWTAEDLYSRAVAEHLQLSSAGSSIELERGVLYEDDGPAAGYSYRPNEEVLQGEVRIKKELLVAHPSAAGAMLLIGPGGEIEATINGRPASLEFAGKQGNYWQSYRFEPGLLRAGSNEFVLGGTGKVWIARDDDFAGGSTVRTRHPNRSAKSTDGGRAWDDARLGTDGNLDGEYYVRLHLEQFHVRGTLTLPVIDAGNLRNQPIGALAASIGPLRVATETTAVEGETIAVQVRNGDTLVPHPEHWSDWRSLPLADGVVDPSAGRFFQLRYQLATEDAGHSPQLKRLILSTSLRPAEDWTRQLQRVEKDDRQIQRTSIPFRYEPFDRAELNLLRQKFELDKVVAGAATEWELIQRLSAWSATRWQRGHLSQVYPAWNALQILQSHADGTPVGGFCQQYNLVFLQACESFGLVGRVVSIGPGDATPNIRSGHETVEIWSNEFEKWVHIDGNTAWYFVDGESLVPLSLYELRLRQLAAFAGREHRSVEARTTATTDFVWHGLKSWPAFAELRLIPRSDFLANASPLPLNQGMRGWFWTGHYVWSDAAATTSLLYPHRVRRAESWEWTLNQIRLLLEPLAAAGELRVHLETETPVFAGYWAEIDAEPPRPVAADFVWRLHAGHNRLQIHAKNSAGRAGPTSQIELVQP